MRAREYRYGLLALALVATPLAAAVAAVVVLQGQLPEADLPEATVTVTVETERLTGRQPALLTATLAPPRALFSSLPGGVTTALLVEPGEDVVDGTAVLEVDGVDRLAIASPAPLWRDLAPGDRGADVLALQGFLARHGWLDGEPDGVYGGATAAAVRALGSAIGLRRPQERADRAWFVWLPGESFRLGSFTTQVGAQVPAAGAELAVEARRLEHVALAGLDGSALGLDPTVRYVASVGAATGLAVTVEDGPGAPALAADAVARLDASTFDDDALATGFVERASAVEVATVPAAGVLTGTDGGTCVYLMDTDGPVARAVTVSGSRGSAALVSAGLRSGQRVVVNPRAAGVGARCP